MSLKVCREGCSELSFTRENPFVSQRLSFSEANREWEVLSCQSKTDVSQHGLSGMMCVLPVQCCMHRLYCCRAASLPVWSREKGPGVNLSSQPYLTHFWALSPQMGCTSGDQKVVPTHSVQLCTVSEAFSGTQRKLFQCNT